MNIQKMKDADAIVFGGANYFNMLNALGQATLEAYKAGKVLGSILKARKQSM